jgi:hypothetical protein
MTMKYDNEELIDLDAPDNKPVMVVSSDPDSGETSVLEHLPPTSSERMKTALFGFFAGLVIALIPSIAVVIFLLNENAENIFPRVALIPAAGAVLGAAVWSLLFDYSCRKGLLRVDRNILQYSTWTGVNTVPLGTVFGAGSEGSVLGEVLRVCAVSDDNRGFVSMTPRFSRYGAISGPARRLGGNVEEGNEFVRKVIIYHIDERRKQGLPVAELPPFHFKSVQAHKKYLITGESLTDATFECDGKILVYENKDGRREIPVTAVRKTTVIEHRSQHGRTAYRVKLTLDPGTGHEELLMDILRMSYPEEIDRYCRCLPTLFPREREF